MTADARKIAAELLALPTPTRAYLAHELLASFDGGDDEGAEAEWMAVIDRRSTEIESGRVECRPVAEVVKDIRAKLDAQGR
jgi:hypothetical protein